MDAHRLKAPSGVEGNVRTSEPHAAEIMSDFDAGLSTAVDEDARFDALAAALSRLGTRCFAFVRVDFSGETRTRIDSTYPPNWMQRYVKRGFHWVDPVLDAARTASTPFEWRTQLVDNMPISTLAAPQRALMEEAATYDLLHGVTVPLPSRDAAVSASLTVVWNEAGQAVARGSTLALLHLLGLRFFAETERAFRTTLCDPDLLTHRERACLTWAARGRTRDETAAILSISYRTVTFHIENAKKKLHALSLPHAVQLALRRGLIDP